MKQTGGPPGLQVGADAAAAATSVDIAAKGDGTAAGRTGIADAEGAAHSAVRNGSQIQSRRRLRKARLPPAGKTDRRRQWSTTRGRREIPRWGDAGSNYPCGFA